VVHKDLGVRLTTVNYENEDEPEVTVYPASDNIARSAQEER